MIQKYVREQYGEILEVAKVITKGRAPDYEDLAHEVMVLLLEGNRDKMNLLVKKGAIKWYIIRSMMNQYRSSTSRYDKKYRKQTKFIRKEKKALKEHMTFLAKLDLTDSKKLDEKVLDFITEKLNDVGWFEKNCFDIYYWDMLTLDSMSELTGISRNTLYRAIRDTRNHIQDEIKESRLRR